MAALGGSPLGIIGLKSVSTNKYSTFNGGPNSNFDVSEYNRSKGRSLFSGHRRLRAWPDIRASKSTYVPDPESTDEPNENDKQFDTQDTTGISEVYLKDNKLIDNSKSFMEPNQRGSNLLHNNDVYDTSVLNILEKLQGTKAAMRPTDFAYLKYLGVYPNNRLMVARRFASASGDNIMIKRRENEISSIATLVSWVPENNESFVEINFGEVWVESKADFTGMLNSLGEDFSKSALGGAASAVGNAIPLPGFTEIFQRQFLAKMGLLEKGAGNQIPAGNPNLIKEAKVRKTIGYSEAGAGLMAKVSIAMTCEYELKFISGIDPTMVWMDIIGMIVRFGTSESSNYGLSGGVAAKLASWAADPYKMIEDVIFAVKNAIKKSITDLKKAVEKAFTAAKKAAEELSDGSTAGDGTGGAPKKSDREVANEAAKSARDMGMKLINKLFNLAVTAIRGSVMKYRVEVMGIVNALTGNASTPWHITIGNPLRPVFCSGDMLTTDVKLKFGPILAFNDLPSTIIAEFTLTNARNLGMQEIMSKFNSGYLRTVDVQKTFFETSVKTETGADGKDIVTYSKEMGKLPGDESVTTSFVTPSGGGDDPLVVDNKGTTGDINVINGTNGTNGNGTNGTQGTTSDGTNGTQGTTSDGTNGTQGTTSDGTNGTQGTTSDGTNGTNGI
jgi:hypothetical protein